MKKSVDSPERRRLFNGLVRGYTSFHGKSVVFRWSTIKAPEYRLNENPLIDTPMLVYALPLVIVFSLCYAATRHEEMGLILPHAARFGGWLAFFLIVAMGIMEFLNWVNH